MTYDYLCTACGNTWEAEQRISEAALTTCPNCKQETAKRQISGAAGFILKGGGWYADLYSSTNKSSGSASEKSAETKPAESKGTTESKPETKPTTSSNNSPAAA
jgi:putative FmdB family regulatory protein